MEFSKDIDKLNKPVVKDGWYMSPQSSKCILYSYNEIVFPTAICLSTIIKLMKVNYGGTGAVVVMKFLMVLMILEPDIMQMELSWWTAGDLEHSQYLELPYDQYSALELLCGVVSSL
jgi:hypothetical protein